MILIISSKKDIHAILVQKELRSRGEEVEIFDLMAFSDDSFLSYEIRENSLREFMVANENKISLKNITSIWYRRPRYPRMPKSVIAKEDRQFGALEWVNAIDGVLSLDVNHPQNQDAAIKPKQLEIARDCSLRIPETLITNNPAKAEEFLIKHGNRVVHKAMSAPSHRFLETRLWKEDDRRHLSDLPLAPTIFQEYISGPYDVRTTVVGDEIFSARITNQDELHLADSRLNLDALNEPYELPEEIRDCIFRLMKKDGFGIWDPRPKDN
jgi:glutathione synthase/RimK-type ligase-like ATP-grasp enzyme